MKKVKKSQSEASRSHSQKKKKKKSSKKKDKKKKKSKKKNKTPEENKNEHVSPEKNNIPEEPQATNKPEQPDEPEEQEKKVPTDPIVKSEASRPPSEPSPIKAPSPPEVYNKSHYKRDCTKNMSFYDTREKATKIKLRMVVPEYLIAPLQLETELARRCESKFNCILGSVADSESRLSTSEGIKGTLVQVAGSLENSMMAMRYVYQEIMVTEEQLNGRRKA